MIKTFKCVRNDSNMPFKVGSEYKAAMVEPSLYRMVDDEGDQCLVPIDGTIVAFKEVKQ